jgi:hypothetical protein
MLLLTLRWRFIFGIEGGLIKKAINNGLQDTERNFFK